MTKKVITVVINDIDFCGDTLDEYIAMFQEYKLQTKDTHKNVCIETETVNYPYDDQDHFKIYLKGDRLETDEEHDKRTKEEAVYKANWEASERAQYKVLAKKYGNKA